MNSPNSIQDKLEIARRDLLDLSTRNRLISTSRSTARSGRLEIVDELTAEVFRLLVQDKKSMTLLSRPGKDDEEENPDESEIFLFQPEDDGDEEEGIAARHTDTNLQTTLTSEQLQRFNASY